MEIQENTASNLFGSDENKKMWVKPTVDIISQDLIKSGHLGGREGATSSAGPVGVS